MVEISEIQKGDVSLRIPLRDQLKGMLKPQLIGYASDRFGVTVSEKLTIPVIIDELVKLDNSIKAGARSESEEATRQSISEGDPEITIVFHNMQTADEDIKFSYPGPKGMYGPINLTGHKKCPKYHLFPGMEIGLPYSVVEHLRSKICTRHKAVFDPVTGLQCGVEPIISPRFLLDQRISKSEAVMLQKMRNKNAKEKE